MGLITRAERIEDLVIDSITEVTLPSSLVHIGGQQKEDTATLDTSVSGFGGIDTGAIAADSNYAVYAVISGGAVGLTFSLSHILPAGFLAFRKIGNFGTNGSSEILFVMTYDVTGQFSEWVDVGVLIIGATTTPPTKGTTAFDKMWLRKLGDSAQVRMEYRNIGGAPVVGSGDYLFGISGGLLIDLTKINLNNSVEGSGGFNIFNAVGVYAGGGSVAPANTSGEVSVFSATQVRCAGVESNNASSNSIGVVGSGFNSITTNRTYAMNFTVPITQFAV